MGNNIRVFISYSHADVKLVEDIVEVLEKDEITVLWTKKLTAGTGFTDQLKVFIDHAHIFMPIITESSLARGWVHQEIGYAMALHIPVFPLIIGDVIPGGMLQFLHAIKLSDDPSVIKEQIGSNALKKLLNRESLPALYQRAARVEERAGLMKLYSDKVSSMGKYGVVRQKGGLSSFHIPAVYIEHQVWNDRYAPEMRGLHHKDLQLGERKALQIHADNAGCRLIINPLYAIEGRSTLAARTRIKTMIEFMNSMSDENLVVALQSMVSGKESLTMVGDWFLAESVSFKDGDGFTNTFFTRNASEIERRIQTFDEEMKYLLEQRGWTIKNSRIKTIKELSKILDSIK